MPTPSLNAVEPVFTTDHAAKHATGHAAHHAGVLYRWLDAEGRRYLLRTLQADDAELLGTLWNDGLSRSARFNRFHASLGRFSPERLRSLCQPQPHKGGAFLITQLIPGGERAVAEGRWGWTGGAGQAELSMAVGDRWQGCGLGRRMLQALTQAARQAGASDLRAQVLPGNGAMQALLARCGYTPCAAGLCGSDDDDDCLAFAHQLQARQPQRLHGLKQWAARAQVGRTRGWNRLLDGLTAAALRFSFSFHLRPSSSQTGLEA